MLLKSRIYNIHKDRQSFLSASFIISTTFFCPGTFERTLTIVFEMGSSSVLSPVNLVSVLTPPQFSRVPPLGVDPIRPLRGFGLVRPLPPAVPVVGLGGLRG